VRDRFLGIDFSGAAQAGNAIWIAEGVLENGALHIGDCRTAAALPGSGSARERCLPALVDFIARKGRAVIGCDFPFSLPAQMIAAPRWHAFALEFGERFADSAAFRDDCVKHGGGRELRRACDRDSRVPFAAYNLRVYRQTFHGIRDVLAPLVRGDHALVLPMDQVRDDRPWVIETCPASTLKSAGLYGSYKGPGAATKAARRRILAGLLRRGWLAPLPRAICKVAVDNSGGDALDSIIAAAATARAHCAGAFVNGPCDPFEWIEGRVYF
jgi:hypothetical protein